jgi:hypothetical protein
MDNSSKTKTGVKKYYHSAITSLQAGQKSRLQAGTLR